MTRATASLARRLLLIGPTATVLVPIAACSLPVDERVTPVDRDEFGDQLTQATTTTTTTSTTTSLPTTTVPDDTDVPSEETTTTVAVVPTETVTVYYTRGATDVMQPVEFLQGAPTPIEELIPLLERPTGISEIGYQSAVRPGLIDRLGPVDRGVATVALDQNVLDIMSESVRQRAIAQIVLTVTSFRTPDGSGIGRVRFEVDGDGLPVFVPALGGSSEPGEELAFADFSSLIATTSAPTTSTTVPPTAEPTPTSEPRDGDGEPDQ